MGDAPTVGPGVLGGDDQDELVQHSGRQAFLARADGMPADDAEIELAFPDAILDHLRVGDLELQVYAGILGAKRGDDAGHDVETGGRAGADQERAVCEAVEVGERLARALDRRDGAGGVLLEDTTGLGHGHFPTAPKKQLLPQLSLELADMLGERGL